jgi:hypothetical protein
MLILQEQGKHAAVAINNLPYPCFNGAKLTFCSLACCGSDMMKLLYLIWRVQDKRPLFSCLSRRSGGFRQRESFITGRLSREAGLDAL